MKIVSINIKGGLGNLLFQISTAYSCSLENNMTLIVDPTSYHGAHHGIDRYKNNFFRKIKFSQNFLSFQTYGEKEFKFNKLPKFNDDVKLNGYFQSEKYFSNNREEILDLYRQNEEDLFTTKSKYEFLDFENSVSIHVRRGDYLHLDNFHPTQSIEYYENGYEYFGKDKTFIIFSDDIEWCKKSFNFIEKKFFIDSSIDFEELYLMSYCKNNIIANSSFSWWGAWMNEYDDKKVIAPKRWFGPSLGYHDTSDIYCKNWIIL